MAEKPHSRDNPAFGHCPLLKGSDLLFLRLRNTTPNLYLTFPKRKQSLRLSGTQLTGPLTQKKKKKKKKLGLI